MLRIRVPDENGNIVVLDREETPSEAAELDLQAFLKLAKAHILENRRHIKALEVAAHAIRPAFIPEEWE